MHACQAPTSIQDRQNRVKIFTSKLSARACGKIRFTTTKNMSLNSDISPATMWIISTAAAFCSLISIYAIGFLILSARGCTELHCINPEKLIAKSIDTRFDPCDNFYRFTCTGWRHQHPMAAGVLPHMAQVQLYDMLKTPLHKYVAAGGGIATAGRFLYQCARATQGAMVPGSSRVIFDLIGMTPETLITENNVVRAAVKLSVALSLRLSIPSLLPAETVYNFKKDDNSSLIMLGLAISMDVPFRPWFTLAEQNGGVEEMCKIFVVSILPPDSSEVDTMVQQCVYMTNIVNATFAPFANAFRNETIKFSGKHIKHSYVTLRNLSTLVGQSKLSSSDWVEILKSAVVISPIKEQITEDMVVLLTDVRYIQIVYALFDYKFETKDYKPLLYFLAIAACSSNFWLVIPDINVMSGIFRATYLQLCIQSTTAIFSPSFTVFHTINMYPERDIMWKKANELTGHVCRSMENYIKTNKWMDQQTQEQALKRLAALQRYIELESYLNTIEKVKAVHDVTEMPDMNSKQLPEKFYYYVRQASDRALYHLFGPSKLVKLGYNRGQLKYTMFTVNAFYLPMFHIFAILDPILQKPLFTPELLDAILFAGIGHVIGHEISHAFDSSGGHIGLDGLAATWLTDESLLRQEQKFACIRSLFAGIPWVWQRNLTFDKTQLSENIADVLGNEIVIRAFLSSPAGNTSRFTGDSPLSKYSPLQLFSILNCFKWCTQRLPLTTQVSDVHSPAMIRCNVPLAVLPQFSDAFKCPSNSRMKSISQKCSFYD